MHIPRRLNQTLVSTSAFEVEAYLVETDEYSIARSTNGMVGVTWNRSETRPHGFPHSYSHQQWFILPEPLAGVVEASSALFESEAEQGEGGDC